MNCRFLIRALRASALAAAPAIVMLGFAAPAQAGSCGAEYTVQSGDTLSGIATRCDTSVEALMDANPQITSPSRLSIGWKLAVPNDHEGMSSSDPVAALADPDERLTLEGRIVNGRRCALLETSDGQEYGVVSPELSFRSGRFVAVAGRMIEDASCGQARTLLVSELSEISL